MIGVGRDDLFGLLKGQLHPRVTRGVRHCAREVEHHCECRAALADALACPPLAHEHVDHALDVLAADRVARAITEQPGNVIQRCAVLECRRRANVSA